MKAALPALLLVLAASPGVARAESALEHCTALAARADELAGGVKSRPLDEGKAQVETILSDATLLGAWELDGIRLQQRWVEHARSQLDEAQEPDRVRDVAEFAADRLVRTCRQLSLPTASPSQTDKSRLVAILSRPEYELRARDENFLARLFERIRTWFRDVLLTSTKVQSAALSIRTLFLVGACLLAAWLAFRITRTTLRRRARAKERDLDGPIVLDDPRRYELGANQALTAGDGREAIRLGLLTLLATLERLRLAAPGRAATNREIAVHITDRGGSEELSQETRALVDWYDRAWYSLRPVSDEEARGFVQRVARVRERAGADARALSEAA